MEYLDANFDWLEERLKPLHDKYILFDCPGQVELYTHNNSVRRIVQRLQKLDYRVRAVVFCYLFVPLLNVCALCCLCRVVMSVIVVCRTSCGRAPLRRTDQVCVAVARLSVHYGSVGAAARKRTVENRFVKAVRYIRCVFVSYFVLSWFLLFWFVFCLLRGFVCAYVRLCQWELIDSPAHFRFPARVLHGRA